NPQFFHDEVAAHEQLGDAHQIVPLEARLHGHEFHDLAHVKTAVAVRYRNFNLKDAHVVRLDDGIHHVVFCIIVDPDEGLEVTVSVSIRPGGEGKKVCNVRVVLLGQLHGFLDAAGSLVGETY